ncbi:MAG: DUF3575 domain-containing protein [Rikenellaceae bacterium]
MDFCRFTTFTWIISIALLLGCQRLCAQQYYIDPAKYSLIPGEPPYKALSFENPHQDFDWEVDSLPRRTLFAVKTNLLFNAVTALNVELEIPIGDRYSIAGEWIFPWWLSDSRQRCFELLCGTVEGRRWLGDRTGVEQLTGWAVGLYAGCGYYDFEWDGTGYQGENVIAGGISAAYAHSIGENLRLEYSLGVGLLTTKYRKYKAQQCGDDWNLKLTERSTKHFFGPTRCRISLAWMLHRADKRGGKR